jgi:hypothetical protein
MITKECFGCTVSLPSHTPKLQRIPAYHHWLAEQTKDSESTTLQVRDYMWLYKDTLSKYLGVLMCSCWARANHSHYGDLMTPIIKELELLIVESVFLGNDVCSHKMSKVQVMAITISTQF